MNIRKGYKVRTNRQSVRFNEKAKFRFDRYCWRHPILSFTLAAVFFALAVWFVAYWTADDVHAIVNGGYARSAGQYSVHCLTH